MSNPVLDATTSDTSGVLSFMLRSQSVRLNQPEDYTVPRPVLGAAPPPARERNRARHESRKISSGSDSAFRGRSPALFLATSGRDRRHHSRPRRNRIPQRQQASG